jgi:class 3 adenylate cyclase
MSFNDSPRLQSTKLVLVLADLAGYAKCFRDHPDQVMAAFIHRFYLVCADVIEAHHGRVVKFMGDACHAVFPGDGGADAVAGMLDLRRGVATLAAEHHLNVELGANVHCGMVVEGQYGRPTDPHYDVMGSAMNHTALMGRGPGLRLSEPVYRQLASAARSPWRRVKAAATYHYQDESPDA